MRMFDECDTMFILENDDRMSLSAMAGHFNCSVKDLYEYYSELLGSGKIRVHMARKQREYKKRKELKRIIDLMRGKEVTNEPSAIIEKSAELNS